MALPIPRSEIMTVGYAEKWDIPINKQTNPCYAYTYEIPIDCSAWTALYTALKGYAYFRVMAVTLQVMPPTVKAVPYAAFSNADTASSVSSSTYAEFFDQQDDWIYTKRGTAGVPLKYTRQFNNLPWVSTTSRAGNAPAPTIAIAAAWYDAEGTTSQGHMRATISFECYGTANK